MRRTLCKGETMINCATPRCPKKRVLIIDDEPGFTSLLKMNLEQKGEYDVCCENDSGHAVETARRFHPDIVFLDIVMPGIDGGEVASRFHHDPELGATPIIFLTALIDNAETGGGVVKHANGEQMIGKPMSMEAVCDCLDRNLYD